MNVCGAEKRGGKLTKKAHEKGGLEGQQMSAWTKKKLLEVI